MWIYVVGAVVLLIAAIFFFGRQIDASYALGDPVATRLRKQILEGEWEKVAPVLEATRSDPDLRTYYVMTLTPNSTLETLDEWCKKRPDSPEAFLFRGNARIRWAWDARGFAAAADTSEKKFERFFQRLELAREDLERAGRLLPDDSIVWSSMLHIARGLQWRLEDVRQLFREATRCDPRSMSAHRHYLLACTKKWGGSHELMFQVAREASANAPEGDLLHLLILLAHSERWLRFDMDGDPAGAEAYLKRADVREEVVRAYEASLGSPHHKPRRETIFARHDAAYWFWLVRDKARLAREIELIGDRIDPWEWCYGPPNAFKKAKAWARS